MKKPVVKQEKISTHEPSGSPPVVVVVGSKKAGVLTSSRVEIPKRKTQQLTLGDSSSIQSTTTLPNTSKAISDQMFLNQVYNPVQGPIITSGAIRGGAE